MTRPYRVVVAPDKFKGSLDAEAVTETIAGVLSRRPGVEIVKHPVADGGEGTVDVALAVGFDPIEAPVTGPLGRPVVATFATRGDTAVIEMASAAGLALLPNGPDPDTAWRATTYGVGELIRAALDHGATQVVVGAGGSATTDGGEGALRALGLDVVELGRHGVGERQRAFAPKPVAQRFTVDEHAGLRPGVQAALEARLIAEQPHAIRVRVAHDLCGFGALESALY